ESVDESCDQVVEVCQPMDTSTTCNATGDDPMPLCRDVRTQCCINARTLVNAETQTNESFTSTYCLSSDSQPPPANINTHLVDHNYYADHNYYSNEREMAFNHSPCFRNSLFRRDN
ncbi:Hypothetical predicted protein, partial [Paramuricea clavata]